MLLPCVETRTELLLCHQQRIGVHVLDCDTRNILQTFKRHYDYIYIFVLKKKIFFEFTVLAYVFYERWFRRYSFSGRRGEWLIKLWTAHDLNGAKVTANRILLKWQRCYQSRTFGDQHTLSDLATLGNDTMKA